MAANLVNEDLWEKVILQAGPGEIPALNREMAAALRRDTLYKAFAARRAPRLWGALGAAPPGRDRFRRAVLLSCSPVMVMATPRGTPERRGRVSCPRSSSTRRIGLPR